MPARPGEAPVEPAGRPSRPRAAALAADRGRRRGPRGGRDPWASSRPSIPVVSLAVRLGARPWLPARVDRLPPHRRPARRPDRGGRRHRDGATSRRAARRCGGSSPTGGGTPTTRCCCSGDLVYEDGDADLIDERRHRRRSRRCIDAGAELLPVLRQPRLRQRRGGRDLRRSSAAPIRGTSSDVGSVRVVVLDSNRVDDEDQTAWLARHAGRAGATRHVDDRGHAPPRLLGRGARVRPRGPRGVEPPVRAVRRAAGAGRPRPRLPALPAPGRGDLRGQRRAARSCGRPGTRSSPP